MHRGQADLLNGKLLIEERKTRCQEDKLFKLATLGINLFCLREQNDNSLTSCLPADFCTAFMPDSDKIEPAERSSKGESFGAWKKSKTDIRSSKKAAFTLAEVLITLGVIGVVAAMTIPTLITKYKEHATVNMVKEVYSIFSQANLRAREEQGDFYANSRSAYYDYIKPYLKIQKDCGTESGCFPDTVIKFLDGTDWTNLNSVQNYYKFILANGVNVQIYNQLFTNIAEVRFDVNGFKGPNTCGIDIFNLTIENGNITTGNATEEDFNILCNPKSNTPYNGAACTSWILKYGNMDYLHK